MDVSSTTTVGRGRAFAFRIIAGVLGALLLVYPSSIGTVWGVIALFVGVVYIAVGEITDRAKVDAA